MSPSWSGLIGFCTILKRIQRAEKWYKSHENPISIDHDGAIFWVKKRMQGNPEVINFIYNQKTKHCNNLASIPEAALQ